MVFFECGGNFIRTHKRHVFSDFSHLRFHFFPPLICIQKQIVRFADVIQKMWHRDEGFFTVYLQIYHTCVDGAATSSKLISHKKKASPAILEQGDVG